MARSKYTTKYKPMTQTRNYTPIVMWILGIALLLLLVFFAVRLFVKKGDESYAKKHHAPEIVSVVRLARSQIPHLNLSTLNYREAFNDLNDLQLTAAKLNGADDLDHYSSLDQCPNLVRIHETDYYVLDSMRYSKPYLVPKAAMLLDYIGERFSELMDSVAPEHHYRLIVTSCLRSQMDVQQLRRRNRNATENSCHCYGTSLDISYIRFVDEKGTECNELFLKEQLAHALYELRFEGLCYVKYERGQSCFHITVRDNEYRGNLESETKEYKSPGNNNSHSVEKHNTAPRRKTVEQSAKIQSTDAPAKDSKNLTRRKENTKHKTREKKNIQPYVVF